MKQQFRRLCVEQWTHNLNICMLNSSFRTCAGWCSMAAVSSATDCTSSLSNMFRVIVLNSSYIILTVFCHLVRQPSCQAAFPDGYCSDPFQHCDVKMPRILSSENVLTLLLFFDTFHNEFFLFQMKPAKLTSALFSWFGMAAT